MTATTFRSLRGFESSVKSDSTGSPLLDRFHGIGDPDAHDLSATPDGLALAYRVSVWVYRCIQSRSEAISDIKLYVTAPNGDPLPPAHQMASCFGANNKTLIRNTESDLLIWGKAYWLISDNHLWVRRLNPQTMEVEKEQDGIALFRQRIDGTLVGEWEPQRIVYFFDYDPDDDLGGLSPTEVVLRDVGADRNISSFVDAYFANDATPAGLLSTDSPSVSKPDQERILSLWKRMFGGVRQSWKVGLAWAGLKYQVITPVPKDLAMPELDERNVRRIHGGYGVVPVMTGYSDAANYATATEQHKQFYTKTALPRISFYTDQITRQWIKPFFGEQYQLKDGRDEIEVLQEDRTELTTRATTSFAAGVMGLNDALRLQKLTPIVSTDGKERDYFFIGGKLLPREALEAGDLSALEPPAAAPAFPFGSFPLPPSQPLPAEPRALADGKSISVTIINDNGTKSEAEIIEGALVSNAELDLKRWEKKALKKGPQTPFTSDYIPSAVDDFLRADLRAWDGVQDRAALIKSAFDRALSQLKATPDAATPEEFEAYWRGIGELFDKVAGAFEQSWQELPARLADAIRQAGQSGATVDLAAFLTGLETEMSSALIGTPDAPGPLAAVFLAGAARGNDLLNRAKSAKQDGVTVSWDVLNQMAVEWARTYSGTLVRGINDTTLTIFREKIAEWIEKGGTLDDLADLIEGKLGDLDIPTGWTPGRIAWATSPERARLIAQTETTNAYHNGAVARWEQAGVQEAIWRTQQDNIVKECEICWPLNNVVGNIKTGWVHPLTGKVYKPAAHSGCRCFGAPKVD